MERIEYAVFWKLIDTDDEWNIFSSWTTVFEDAYFTFKKALKNPKCKEAKIMERLTSYFDVLKDFNYYSLTKEEYDEILKLFEKTKSLNV